MEPEFSSIEELYNRLKPALKAKQTELAGVGYNYLKVEDIWNYLKEEKWKSSHDLALNEMVSDILHADNDLIDAYFKEKLMDKKRKLYFEE